jgi:hypothetical protein
MRRAVKRGVFALLPSRNGADRPADELPPAADDEPAEAMATNRRVLSSDQI